MLSCHLIAALEATAFFTGSKPKLAPPSPAACSADDHCHRGPGQTCAFASAQGHVPSLSDIPLPVWHSRLEVSFPAQAPTPPTAPGRARLLATTSACASTTAAASLKSCASARARSRAPGSPAAVSKPWAVLLIVTTWADVCEGSMPLVKP